MSLTDHPVRQDTAKTTSLSNPVLAIFNVSVIAMDGKVMLPTQTVLIEDNRILRLQRSSKVALPRDAVRIDATGMYLIPGLTDLHVHLQSNGAGPRPLSFL